MPAKIERSKIRNKQCDYIAHDEWLFSLMRNQIEYIEKKYTYGL